MIFFFKILFTSCSFGCLTCTTNTNFTTKRTVDDDYYVNYDYDLAGNNNNSDIFPVRPESLILPNPEGLESKYALPNIELPDDSLADTDLRDHDFIDNLMYVYYGSHTTKSGNGYGPEIIIIGSVLSCAAQLLTIFVVLLQKNFNSTRNVNVMFLHLMGCLCFSNLLFMLGVYATKNAMKCQIIAMILHYLHLLTASWLFFYGYYIYKRFCDSNIPKLHYIFSYAYSLPAILTLLSFIIAPRSYETKRFCFVSVQKGMIVNYMLPVSVLIIVTTMYSLNGIRKINLELSKLEFTSSAESLNALRNELEQVECAKKRDTKGDREVTSLKECKRCLKSLCVVQTSYDMVWFVAVLALENVHYSNSMSVVYSITSCLLNWYIFAKVKSFLPTLLDTVTLTDDYVCIVEQDIKASTTRNNVSLSQCESSDSIPLLINSETEMCEIRSDYISTISS